MVLKSFHAVPRPLGNSAHPCGQTAVHHDPRFPSEHRINHWLAEPYRHGPYNNLHGVSTAAHAHIHVQTNNPTQQASMQQPSTTGATLGTSRPSSRRVT